MEAASTPVAAVERYRSWLLSERGLSAETARCYGNWALKFCDWLGADLAARLAGLTAAEVTGYVVTSAERLEAAESAKAMVTALRSLLRFACVVGWTSRDLSGAVLATASWRLDSIPGGLPEGVTTALADSCDTSTLTGLRDRAVIVLLTVLGLRRGEVAGLRLTDIDWRGGLIQVTGKGNRTEKLPLPAVAGNALAAYVTGGRPVDAGDMVFVTVRKPLRPISPSAVTAIVRQACRRAGIDPVGPHRFRHTLACQMLRAGASLPEIGQILRHQSMLSTSVYAKVDYDRLRRLARPWPVPAGR